MRPLQLFSILATATFVLSACGPQGRDPMARQPDPETHPAAQTPPAGPTADDPSGAPLTNPAQQPDTPPNQDRSDEAMPPPQ